MAFAHVADMVPLEIVDYAVLYGDDIQNLSIKSFSHLDLRDLSEEDWISVFIDTMTYYADLQTPFDIRGLPNLTGRHANIIHWKRCTSCYAILSGYIFKMFQTSNSPFIKWI